MSEVDPSGSSKKAVEQAPEHPAAASAAHQQAEGAEAAGSPLPAAQAIQVRGHF